MTVEQQVLAAKTPRDALLVLARAVDALQVPDPWDIWNKEADPWDVWNKDAPVEEVTDEEITDEDVAAWITRNYGRPPTDDQDGRALLAMVRADLERAGRGEVRTDDFVMDEGVVQSRINWAPRDEAHRAARHRFAKDILQLETALGAHPEGGDWAADYASGGPMWLYIGNWDLIQQYPDNVKAVMIDDVDSYDSRVAYEMGADLLKQPMTKDEHSPAGNLSMLADD